MAAPDEDYREVARAVWAQDGGLEIDGESQVSRVDGGAWVQAWVWVKDDGQDEGWRVQPVV